MILTSKIGDIVDEPVDGLVSTGNVYLTMSGGVNGELLLRDGGEMQRELNIYLEREGVRYVDPGFVIEIGPGPTHFKCIVYTVSVDAFYGSSVELVETSLGKALDMIRARECRTVAVPALATGYGPLSISDFSNALRGCLNNNSWPFEEMRIVLRNESDLSEFRNAYEVA